MTRLHRFLIAALFATWSLTSSAVATTGAQGRTSSPIELARAAMGGTAGFASIRGLQVEYSEVADSSGSRPVIYRLALPDRFQMDNGGGVFTLDSRSFDASTGLTERGLVVARQNTTSAYVRTWMLFLLSAPSGSGATMKPGTDQTIDGVPASTTVMTLPGLTVEMWFSKATRRTLGYRFTSALTTASGESAGTDTSEVMVRSFQTVAGVEFPKEMETKSSHAENFIAKRTVRVIVNPSEAVDKFFAK